MLSLMRIFGYGDEMLARRVAQIERRPVVRTLKDLAKWVESEVQTFHLVRYGAVESAYDVNWFVNNCRGVCACHRHRRRE